LSGADAALFDFTMIDGVGNITLRADASPDFESSLSYEVQINATRGSEVETLTHYVPVSDLMEVQFGTSGDDTLTGARGEDYIDAGAGNDTIIGDERDDWFIGGAGNDSHAGDDGFDTVDYRHSEQVRVARRKGTAIPASSGSSVLLPTTMSSRVRIAKISFTEWAGYRPLRRVRCRCDCRSCIWNRPRWFGRGRHAYQH